MRNHWQSIAVTGFAALAVCATATWVAAAAKKKEPEPAVKYMSVEEARKVASKSAPVIHPPRSIDDITKVLNEHRPNPEAIRRLRETADKQPPSGMGGQALAEFLAARGAAARDLGRTKQRLADLRQAYEICKPLVLRRSPVSITDMPTTSNPMGSPAFQAYVAAKRAAKFGGGGGGGGRGGGGRDMGAMTPQERMRMASRGGGPPAGKTNLDFMPTSWEESRSRLAERVSVEQQHCVRYWQELVSAEAEAGNYTNATAVYEQGRPAVATSQPGVALSADIKMVNVRLAAGDVTGAKGVVARTQQLASAYRARPWTQPTWNNQSANVEWGLGEVAFTTGQLVEAETHYRNAMRFNAAATKDGPRIQIAQVVFETQDALLRLLTAQTLFRQHRLIEAELETRKSLVDFLRLQGEEAPKTARTVLILADILQAQGRYKDAQRLSEAALDIYKRGGVDTVLHADALQRIAVGQASQGHWADAMKTYDKLKEAVANNDAAKKRYLDVNMDLAVALLESNQAGVAIPILEGVVKKRATDGGDNEYSVAEARGFLGAAQAGAGHLNDGMKNLRTAIPVLLVDNASAKEEGAVDDAHRRQMIVEAYFDALTKVKGTEVERSLGIDASDEAFRMADVVHAKSVQSAIAASSARAASGDAALNDLIRQTQDTDQQLAAMSDMLRQTLSAPPDQQDQAGLQSLRRDIGQLQQARKTLRAEIERRFPQYDQLINPKPVGIAQAREKLGNGDTLIVTYFNGGKGYVWAVPQQGDVTFAQTALPEVEIARLVDDIYKAVNSNASSLEEIPPFNVADANKLYTALLDPVAKAWQGSKNLIVIPDGALGRLPFSMLVTKPVAQPQESGGALRFAGYRDVPFLIRDVAVTHVPSVAAFVSLRSEPAGAADRKPFIGFGDPMFSAEQAEMAQRRDDEMKKAQLAQQLKEEMKKVEQKVQLASADVGVRMRAAPKTQDMDSAELAQLPRLPDTAQEVREIARALGADVDKDVILGANASEKTVRTMRLDDRRVVMFATHGLMAGELNGLSEPALALSSPEVPGVEGDGLLTVEKILSLKLDADWVVLSACNTAAGEGGSAEAVSGLGRAFFYAGARALLVTHWPVETTSARELTTDLFRRQAASADLGRSAALREAMMNMIDKGERSDGGRALFAYAHPLFWASFALIGDGESH